MSIRRLITTVAITMALGGLAASPALGHASQVSSAPEADAVLDAAPSEVRIEFESALMDTGAALVVTGADGEVVSDAAPTLERMAIRVAVDPAAAAGEYTVAYRVVSEDGHTITSTYTYTVAAGSSAIASSAPASTMASPVATTASSAPSNGGGMPAWVWIAGVVGAVAIVVALLTGRRSPNP